MSCAPPAAAWPASAPPSAIRPRPRSAPRSGGSSVSRPAATAGPPPAPQPPDLDRPGARTPISDEGRADGVAAADDAIGLGGILPGPEPRPVVLIEDRGHQFPPRPDPDLAEDRLQMVLHGIRGEVDLGRDLTGGL